MQHPIMNLPPHPSLLPPPQPPHPSLLPPPHPSLLPPPPQPPRPTLNHLDTTLSSLTNLLTFSNQILSTTPKPQTLTSNLIPCLFNHNHLLPPSSLFLHHLRCPSSPRPLPDLSHLLTSLSYPQTLHNPQSIHLSSYFDFTSNFFYKYCPGVVTFSEANSVAKTATFHLPDFLSRECSDTTTNTNHNPPSIVPSEFIYISREIESWNNFPTTYSTSVHHAVLGIGIAKENDMDNWIISNSPRYGGIVLDTSMQSHIFLLFSLCFKSILREASVLKNALMWLESQVSILYGVNGKLFVLDFVKKCILAGASVLLLFHLGNDVADSVAWKKQRNITDCIQERKISMPQVVAAVAALHERALLERKIKGFWFSHPSNSYQLKAEHCYLYDKANEERNNRIDYRPIIEYDWVHRQSSYNQGTQKEKTVEELLAEERDYKRRRMSYRGKKRNQAPLQVMRDLIGEYFEMGCQCLVLAAGRAALAYVAYRVFLALYNVLYIYVFAPRIDLKKKAGANWAVVTGATDGIGKAYAEELARRGFNIYLVSRTQSKLDDTAKEIKEKNKVEVKTYAFDFSTGDNAAYKPLLEALNSVEVGVLINNVGMSYEYPEVLHKVEGGLERIGGITTINTLPPTMLSAGILPQMVARKAGIVVNVSSSASYNEMALWAVYSATKKYVTWFSSILRREYESEGIIVQTICPMMVATKMSKVKRTSFFTPNGTNFAKAALNTIGNVSETTGYLTHQIQAEVMNFIPKFVIDHVLTKMSKGTRAAALRKKEREAKAQ